MRGDLDKAKASRTASSRRAPGPQSGRDRSGTAAAESLLGLHPPNPNLATARHPASYAFLRPLTPAFSRTACVVRALLPLLAGVIISVLPGVIRPAQPSDGQCASVVEPSARRTSATYCAHPKSAAEHAHTAANHGTQRTGDLITALGRFTSTADTMSPRSTSVGQPAVKRGGARGRGCVCAQGVAGASGCGLSLALAAVLRRLGDASTGESGGASIACAWRRLERRTARAARAPSTHSLTSSSFEGARLILWLWGVRKQRPARR